MKLMKLMKLKFTKFGQHIQVKTFFICTLLLMIFSCDKEPIVLDDNHISPSESSILDLRASNSEEDDIADFYSYEHELGEVLHSLLFSDILQSDWDSLSLIEQQQISNFSDAEFALLGIWFEAATTEIMVPDYYAGTSSSIARSNILNNNSHTPPTIMLIPPDKFWSCLGTAVGVSSVKEILNIGALDAAAASKSAIRILRAVGSRYLFGWAGLAVAVHSFYTCME